MKTKTLTNRLTIWALVVVAILLIPAVARAPWTKLDYIFAGGVLFGAAFAYEVLSSKMRNKNHRTLVGIATLGFVVAIWAWAVA